MEVNIKKLMLGFLIISIIALLVISSISYIVISNLFTSEQINQDSIAVIEVSGPILGSAGGLFSQGQANADRIMQEINRAKNEERVKAVILKIDSPGGSSAASESIHQELKKLKESGKPIVVSMGSIAASGGYYISTIADQIYANPSTITGSIGVIMQLRNLEELYQKIGVESITFKSGTFKDLGNPDRELLAEEEEIIQNLIDDAYQEFIQVIVEGRELDDERVRELADGRIYNGSQAQELGLIDQLGTFYDAQSHAAQLGGIEGEPNLINYDQSSFLERLLTSFNELTYGLGLRKSILDLTEEELIYYQILLHDTGNNFRSLEINY